MSGRRATAASPSGIAAGKLVQSWDARGPDGNWSTIHGMFVDHNGFLWTNARESQLTVKFTQKGQVSLVIGKYNETGGSNDTDADGTTGGDLGRSCRQRSVHRRRLRQPPHHRLRRRDGKYLRHWGAYGKRPEDPRRDGAEAAAARAEPRRCRASPPQQFSVPHGIAGSRDGLIYLADRANNRIQVFRQNGEYVSERILRPRCGVEEQATWTPKRPCGIEAAFSIGFSHDVPQTYLYVADGGTHVITVLRRSDLEVVSEFGGPGVGPGQLGRPHNLSVDPFGNIYVAEAAGPIVGKDRPLAPNPGRLPRAEVQVRENASDCATDFDFRDGEIRLESCALLANQTVWTLPSGK